MQRMPLTVANVLMELFPKEELLNVPDAHQGLSHHNYPLLLAQPVLRVVMNPTELIASDALLEVPLQQDQVIVFPAIQDILVNQANVAFVLPDIMR